MGISGFTLPNLVVLQFVTVFSIKAAELVVGELEQVGGLALVELSFTKCAFHLANLEGAYGLLEAYIFHIRIGDGHWLVGGRIGG